MIATQESTESRRGTADVVGVDIATTGTKVVRIKRTKQGYLISGIDLLPPAALDPEGNPPTISLPKSCRARHAALAASAEKSIVRLLHLPGFSQQAPNADSTIREHVGLEEGFRMSYRVTTPATRAKPDTGVLAVALPEFFARGLVDMFGSGAPAPVSVEVSGLAALNGFARGPLARHRREAVGFIEAGADTAVVGIFQNEQLVLVRKFDIGANKLVDRVTRQMGVDLETAEDIIRGNAFDIGQMTKEVLGPFLRQLSISKEFVERKGGAVVKQWYLSGGMSLTNYWSDLVSQTVGGAVRIWNPLEGFEVDPKITLDVAKDQEIRFAAAVGAAIGALEES